jgi:iron complex outermembrane receptor protein
MDRTDVPNGYAYQIQDTEAWAVFGQFDYDFSDDLMLTFGLRYSDDSKDYVAERPLTPFGDPNFPLTSEAVSDSQVSGNLTLKYNFNDDVSMYGRFARGFRAPSIQGRVLFSNAITTADSEILDSFEIGVKSQLLDNRVRLNVSVYTLSIDDQQLTAGSGVANANVLINADKTKGQGLEIDAEWAATENLNLSLGVSYNDTEIDDSELSVLPCGAETSPDGGVTISNCTVFDPPGSFAGSVSIDGNDLPRAPEWMYNFVLRYTKPLTNGDFYFQTDWVYRSDFSMFLYDSAEFHADSFTEGGLNIGYVTDRYEVAVYGRNITDELKLIAAIDFNNFEGIINEPQTYGLEVTFRF